MKRVGAHVSIKGGVENAPLNAAKIGARAFALFTRNQLQWKHEALDPAYIERFKGNCKTWGYEPESILVHDSYLINLGSPEQDVLRKSVRGFHEELSRCRQLGLDTLNFHPGSHKQRMSDESCMDQIVACLGEALAEIKGVTAVIENTSGSGGAVGHCFEHLAYLIERVENRDRIGVCLDTCHLFAAGYDIRSSEGYDAVMAEFDRIVGFQYLRGMHLNDSKGALGGRWDRHQSLGKGALGMTPFHSIMNDPRLEGLPLILETPDQRRWAEEIEILYDLIE